MSSSKRTENQNTRSRPPATSPEARENQLISAAYDLAEKQIREGTASSQVLSHFLKMGSAMGRAEKEILDKQKELMTAKTDAIRSSKDVKELYENAVAAMQTYSGGKSDARED